MNYDKWKQQTPPDGNLDFDFCGHCKEEVRTTTKICDVDGEDAELCDSCLEKHINLIKLDKNYFKMSNIEITKHIFKRHETKQKHI